MFYICNKWNLLMDQIPEGERNSCKDDCRNYFPSKKKSRLGLNSVCAVLA